MRLIVALLVGCTATTIAKPQPKPVVTAPAPTTTTVDIDGVAVDAVPFVPARYANRTDISIHVTREGTTVESTTARASFVVTFSKDSVTGCRDIRGSESRGFRSHRA